VSLAFYCCQYFEVYVAKKKSSTVADLGDGGDQFSEMRDGIQAAALKQLQTHFKGTSMLTHDETMWRCGGIAMPALCLRYLQHQEAFPLGRTLTLSGLYGSNKTSLSFEILRWLLIYRGIGWYNDVERKDSPGMRESMLRYDRELLDNVHMLECPTQDLWQSGVRTQFDSVMKMSAKYDNKLQVLGGSIVDSVAAAKPAAEAARNMKEHGGAGHRTHPVVALYNSDWLSGIVHTVAAGPFVLMLIQHSSDVAVEGMPGVTTRKQKGGMEVAFAKTSAFELTKRRDLKETSSGGGVVIKIQCSKNAMGPAKRVIEVPVRWYYEPDPVNAGRMRQQYYWDWHHGTIQLLLSFESMPGRKKTWTDIKAVCDLHLAAGARVWSRALGIPESAPVKFSTAGEILEYEHPELLPGLYNVLHIERRPIMAVGGDVRDIWEGRVAVLDTPVPPPYPRQASRSAQGEDPDDAE
jgi:hypothetical protein